MQRPPKLDWTNWTSNPSGNLDWKSAEWPGPEPIYWAGRVLDGRKRVACGYEPRTIYHPPTSAEAYHALRRHHPARAAEEFPEHCRAAPGSDRYRARTTLERVRVALRDGDYALALRLCAPEARPEIPYRGRRTLIQLRLVPELLQRIDSERGPLTRSEWVRLAICSALGRQ